VQGLKKDAPAINGRARSEDRRAFPLRPGSAAMQRNEIKTGNRRSDMPFAIPGALPHHLCLPTMKIAQVSRATRARSIQKKKSE
jgi:hypothetical protein